MATAVGIGSPVTVLYRGQAQAAFVTEVHPENKVSIRIDEARRPQGRRWSVRHASQDAQDGWYAGAVDETLEAGDDPNVILIAEAPELPERTPKA